MSQMYMHLVNAAFYMQLPNIEACGRGAAPPEEWFALIEMHFRYHLRQKARIDQFLQQPGT